jgi:hypothetical protein
VKQQREVLESGGKNGAGRNALRRGTRQHSLILHSLSSSECGAVARGRMRVAAEARALAGREAGGRGRRRAVVRDAEARAGAYEADAAADRCRVHNFFIFKPFLK